VGGAEQLEHGHRERRDAGPDRALAVAKLEQLLVPDFRETSGVEAKLTGYDACFYCAGVSSVGMKEAEYTSITYDTPVAFATTLARLDPTMVFTYVTAPAPTAPSREKPCGRASKAALRTR
jgi:hypothetical protein